MEKILKKYWIFLIIFFSILLFCIIIFLFISKFKSSKKRWIDPITGIKFIWIKEGEFYMGSSENDKENWSNEYPKHKVFVNGFWIGQFEVTNKEYRIWKKNHNSGEYKGFSLNDDNQPVVMVSWEDAKAFTEWLTLKHNNKFIFRLPTEAEWEYAARAGVKKNWYWGNNLYRTYKYANIADKTAKKHQTNWGEIIQCEDGYAVSSPVGTYKPNAFGLYDMLGNVFEWCYDWLDYDYYSKSQKNNPQGPCSGKYKVMRGGSWWLQPSLARSTCRFNDIPIHKDINCGFRVVLDKNLLIKL